MSDVRYFDLDGYRQSKLANLRGIRVAEREIPEDGSPDVDNFLFNLLNKKRDLLRAPKMLHPTLYQSNDLSDVTIESDRFEFRYSSLGVAGAFVNGPGEEPSKSGSLLYTWYESQRAKERIGAQNYQTLVLTHGVPVNRVEWAQIARVLVPFCRVVIVDLLGMGGSSMPLAFHPAEDAELPVKDRRWHWSWALHANVFRLLFQHWRRERGDWLGKRGRVFFGANDWGSGVVTKFMELYGEEYLLGASTNSPIALNGYWVQHIGSLAALAMAPYGTPQFHGMVVQFAGTLTMLLETMFHRSKEHINQYSMSAYQWPYVEISYSNPEKNPANTIYRDHAVRVLAEQASVALGNGELLPYQKDANPRGLRYSRINVPWQCVWGENDRMMPANQVHRFRTIVSIVNAERAKRGQASNLTFWGEVIADAGHFAIADQPEKSAQALVAWMSEIVGPKKMGDVPLGFEGIARQDEIRMRDDLRAYLASGGKLDNKTFGVAGESALRANIQM